MKKAHLVLFAALMIFISAPINAQSGDFSLWIKMTRGNGPELIPWFTYASPSGLFVEARQNFDWRDSSTLFLGKTLSHGKTTLVPEAGIIWTANGGYQALTPQVLCWGGGENWSWVAMNQLAFGMKAEDTDFFYHWTEILWWKNPNIRLGFSGQVYWEFGTDRADPAPDVGPVIKVLFPQPQQGQTFYVKVWPTVNPTDTNIRKMFVGMGVMF